MSWAKLLLRIALSVASGVVTVLGTMTAGCNDRGGVSSWEQCRSWLGNPILRWPGGNWSPLFALGLGIGVGYLVWWSFGRSQKALRVTTVVVVAGVTVGLTPLVISAFTV